MNKFICNILAATLSLSAYSASAATTTPNNTDDGSAIGTSETPQIKQQDQTIDSAPSKKNMHKKNTHKKSHKMNSDMPDDDNSGSMNSEPTETTK